MQVRVIKKSNVFVLINQNKDMANYFHQFFQKLSYADWSIPQDVTKSFKSADLITCGEGAMSRMVFNVGNNKYRMICGYYFGVKEVILYIKFVGTHKEYDKVNVCTIDLFKK